MIKRIILDFLLNDLPLKWQEMDNRGASLGLFQPLIKRQNGQAVFYRDGKYERLLVLLIKGSLKVAIWSKKSLYMQRERLIWASQVFTSFRKMMHQKEAPCQQVRNKIPGKLKAYNRLDYFLRCTHCYWLSLWGYILHFLIHWMRVDELSIRRN